MPLESGREDESGVFNVQDASMPGAAGATGGVKQQRPHQQGVPCGGGTEKVWLLGAQFLDAFGRKSAKPMRARQDTQGTVAFVGIVEMKTNREHLLQQIDGRLNVGNTVLAAPRAEAGRLNASAKSQRQILMPGHQPVGFRRLVEVDGADGQRLGR